MEPREDECLQLCTCLMYCSFMKDMSEVLCQLSVSRIMCYVKIASSFVNLSNFYIWRVWPRTVSTIDMIAG